VEGPASSANGMNPTVGFSDVILPVHQSAEYK